ncbi:MAG: hypothetical protein MUP17_06470 [candidate division Zixibacteria bacterium]|nr:hypothetical protein [candidate division Zixibacteria bacterium]
MRQNDDQVEGEKEKNQLSELGIHLEEYKNLSGQISKRVDYQQSLLNYQILLIGIIVTAGVSFLNLGYALDSSISVLYFLLLAPLPFYSLSWSFSTHDINIVRLARYLNRELRPRIKKLIGNRDILLFEDFLSEERKRMRKTFGILPKFGEGRLLLLLFPPVILILLFLISLVMDLSLIMNQKRIDIYRLLFLFVINIVFIIITMKFSIKVGKDYRRITESDSE